MPAAGNPGNCAPAFRKGGGGWYCPHSDTGSMLFRVFPGQALEEDDTGAITTATKVRWPLWPKWGWTADTTEKLEQADLKVYGFAC